ncbi:hypothetical protein CANARDRAFT_114376 [[Candida] arabinofermentans NRRL YB-2248]|uniref:Uncharacterized protein n=1 Tax=[Candida] arabinofermentans NRRL YB-2248 TaxID=983967 RepID=A0A1E4T4K8_9ASCO|nr:hypothetical protein CANARDRAFT_114376 [[Candida] arabinofermentans NRRL YB-2248]
MSFTNQLSSFSYIDTTAHSKLYYDYDALLFGQQLVDNLSPVTTAFKSEEKVTDHKDAGNLQNELLEFHDFSGPNMVDYTIPTNIRGSDSLLSFQLAGYDPSSANHRLNAQNLMTFQSPTSSMEEVELFQYPTDAPQLFGMPSLSSSSSILTFASSSSDSNSYSPNSHDLPPILTSFEINDNLIELCSLEYDHTTHDEEIDVDIALNGSDSQYVAVSQSYHSTTNTATINKESINHKRQKLGGEFSIKASPPLVGNDSESTSPALKKSPISQFKPCRKARSRSVTGTTANLFLKSSSDSPSSPSNPFYKPPAILRRFSDIDSFKLSSVGES